jgi:hypothetical protein
MGCLRFPWRNEEEVKVEKGHVQALDNIEGAAGESQSFTS